MDTEDSAALCKAYHNTCTRSQAVLKLRATNILEAKIGVLFVSIDRRYQDYCSHGKLYCLYKRTSSFARALGATHQYSICVIFMCYKEKMQFYNRYFKGFTCHNSVNTDQCVSKQFKQSQYMFTKNTATCCKFLNLSTQIVFAV